MMKRCLALMVLVGCVSPVDGSVQLQTGAVTLFSTMNHQTPIEGDGGDVLVLPGAGFVVGDTVVVAASSGSTLLADVLSVAEAAVIVRLPSSIKRHTKYTLWVERAGSKVSNDVSINDVRPLWFSPAVAYRKAKYAGLPRTLRVMGRNLDPKPGTKPTKVRLISGSRKYTRNAKILTSPALDTGILANTNIPTGFAAQHQGQLNSFVAEINLPNALRCPGEQYPCDFEIFVKRGGTSQWVQLNGVSWASQQSSATPACSSGNCPSVLTVFSNPAVPAEHPHNCVPRGENDPASDITNCLKSAIESAPAGSRVSLPSGIYDLGMSASTAAGTEHKGIVVPDGVSIVGSAATQIRKHLYWSGRPIFTVNADSRISNIDFFTDPALNVNNDGVTGHIELGYKRQTGQSVHVVVHDIIIEDCTFTHSLYSIRGEIRRIERLAIVRNTFTPWYVGIVSTGDANYNGTRYFVRDAIVRDNTFYPSDMYFDGTRQGPIPSSLGGYSRLDYSNNIIDGRVPTGSFRSGPFFTMVGNNEMNLLSGNQVYCVGDSTNFGEGIAFDGNHNDLGYPQYGAANVVSATSSSLTLDQSLYIRIDAGAPVTDYYDDHWLLIVDGPGIGQARRIDHVTNTFGANPVVNLAGAFDVLPTSASRAAVIRNTWQTHIVDNLVDTGTGCEKDNIREHNAGMITLYGASSDSTISGNMQNETSGVLLNAGGNAPSYFDEVRKNSVWGEFRRENATSVSGIRINAGPSTDPSPGGPWFVPAVGSVIADNKVFDADHNTGAAITFYSNSNSVPTTRFASVFGNTVQNSGPLPTEQHTPCYDCTGGYFNCATGGTSGTGFACLPECAGDATKCQQINTPRERHSFRFWSHPTIPVVQHVVVDQNTDCMDANECPINGVFPSPIPEVVNGYCIARDDDADHDIVVGTTVPGVCSY